MVTKASQWKTLGFSGSFVACDLKVVTNIQLIELMKSYVYLRSRSSFDIGQRSLTYEGCSYFRQCQQSPRHCPWIPWTLSTHSMGSMDIVHTFHGFHGQCPWILWKMSRMWTHGIYGFSTDGLKERFKSIEGEDKNR